VDFVSRNGELVGHGGCHQLGGLYHPGVQYTLGGTAGTGSLPEGYATGYLSPVLAEHLDHNIVYEYEYYLILGALAEIRDYVYAHRPPPLPHWHFQKDRQHWVYLNTTDSGYPIAGKLHVNLSSGDPGMMCNAKVWNAADVPQLYIRAKYSAANAYGQMFWQNLTDGGFGDKSMYLSLIPDGQYHTYAVDLSLSPLYTGVIKQLRFDPVQTGAAGEYADIEYISAYPFPGDLNRDETVDFSDFAAFASHWRQDRAAGFVGDLDGDRKVGWEDLSIFTTYWLKNIGSSSKLAGELDGLYYSGGSPVWPAIRLNTNRYVALANNYGSANQFFGAKADGGVDAIANYGSGWQTIPLVPGTYRALATDYGSTNWVFGANAAGGVYAIYYSSGSWTVAQVNPHDFVSLANVGGIHQFMGVRSDGRLEFTYLDGGSSSWMNYLVGTNLCTRAIYDPKKATSVYALRADGGIDRVAFNGSVWVTTTVDHSRVYVVLTADNTVTNWVYGATAGALYAIVDTGGGFSATLVNTNSYKALEHIAGVSYQLFGARADGTGLQPLYFDGSKWVRYLANPKDYGVLLHDAFNGNLYAGAPASPARSR